MSALPTDVTYAQFAQLPHLINKEGNSPEGLRKAAQHFESLFLDMWLKSAREANESIASDNFMNTQEMQMHQQMMDKEMAIHLSKNGGVGLADVIVRQLSGEAPTEVPGRAVSRVAVGGHERELSSDDLKARAHTGMAVPDATDAEVREINSLAQRAPGFSDKEAFVNTLKPIVEKALQKAPLPLAGVLGQAALETGWGSQIITGNDGALSHNLFGMKAKSDSEPSVAIGSMEFEFGRWVNRLSNFRAYPDWEASVRDYVQSLSADPRYQRVMEAGDDLSKFASGLMQSGYATDPQYAMKLVDVAERIAEEML